LPVAKADFVKGLQQQGKIVAMAGDASMIALPWHKRM